MFGKCESVKLTNEVSFIYNLLAYLAIITLVLGFNISAIARPRDDLKTIQYLFPNYINFRTKLIAKGMLPIPQIRSRELYPEMKCGADGGICEAFWKIQRNGLQQQIIFLLQSPDRMNPNSVPYVVMGIQDIDIFPSP